MCNALWGFRPKHDYKKGPASFTMTLVKNKKWQAWVQGLLVQKQAVAPAAILLTKQLALSGANTRSKYCKKLPDTGFESQDYYMLLAFKVAIMFIVLTGMNIVNRDAQTCGEEHQPTAAFTAAATASLLSACLRSSQESAWPPASRCTWASIKPCGEASLQHM